MPYQYLEPAQAEILYWHTLGEYDFELVKVARHLYRRIHFYDLLEWLTCIAGFVTFMHRLEKKLEHILGDEIDAQVRERRARSDRCPLCGPTPEKVCKQCQRNALWYIECFRCGRGVFPSDWHQDPDWDKKYSHWQLHNRICHECASNLQPPPAPRKRARVVRYE